MQSATQPTALTGHFFILIGPAGAGKNTLMQHVLATHAGRLHQLPTATSRPIRASEQQGREHVFLTRAGFEAEIAAGALLEHQWVHGNLYGILRATLDTMLATLPAIIADIEILGAQIARSAYPANTIALFIQPPSIASLYARMQQRGDTPAEIARRLLRVPLELAYARECDAVIANDEVGEAARTLDAVVTAALESRSLALAHPPELRFEYRARVVPVCGAETLVSADARLFEPTLADGEDPAARARLLLAAHGLGDTGASPSTLIGSAPDPQKPDFLPPHRLTIETDEDADGQFERVIYEYQAHMAQRIDAPPGMQWAVLEHEPSAAGLAAEVRA